MKPSATLVALLHGPDQPGIVAKTAGWIFARHGNILHADQHRDMEAGIFFQRVEWEPSFAKATESRPVDLAAAEAEFRKFGESLGMKVQVTSSADRLRVALFGKDGLQLPALPPQPDRAQKLRRRIRDLREMAARGMSVRAFTREADALQIELDKLESVP